MSNGSWAEFVRWVALGSTWGAVAGTTANVFLADASARNLPFYFALAYWLHREARRDAPR